MATADEVRARMAQFVIDGRAEKKLSKYKLACMVGVDSKTVTAWESGKTMPDMLQFSMLCEAFGKNTIREHSRIIHPEMYANQNSSGPIEDIRMQLCQYVYAAPDFLCRQLHYCSCSAHGSYFPAQVQAMVALNHMPLQAKVFIATNTAMLYEMNDLMNALRDKDNVMPDMALYHKAIESGKQSLKLGREHYTMDIDHE